jgi:hypothetical protein
MTHIYLPSAALVLLAAVFTVTGETTTEQQDEAVAGFNDVRVAAGLEGFPPHGWYGIAWGDFNSDGWEDLFAGGLLWVNRKGRFEQLSTDVGERAYGVWGDYDNDGDLDLFTYSPAQVFRNEGNVTFVAQSFPPVPMSTSQSACCGDFDGDGDLDIYIGGYEDGGYQPDAIFTNAGDCAFSLSWQTPGRRQPARGASPADFDEDGDLDIYVSNYRLEANSLLQNDGHGNFENVGAAYGVSSPGLHGHTVGSAWGDLDNDGHLDLVVGNFSHPGQPPPQLLRNLGAEGEFRFENKTAGAGLAWVESHTNPALGDYDNDGDLDLFICAAYKGDTAKLYRNNGDWTFTDVTDELGITGERLHSASWADYDNDGWLDLLVQRYQTIGHLYRNRGGANHWLKVRLAGTSAVPGAQVRVGLDKGGGILTRQVEGATGECNQSPATLHFGLGLHDGPVTLEIRWPGGERQAVTTEVDRVVVVEKPVRTAAP